MKAKLDVNVLSGLTSVTAETLRVKECKESTKERGGK
jgi:hypothetical protein